MDAATPPTEYRAHLGTCDAIAATPLVADVVVTGGIGLVAIYTDALGGDARALVPALKVGIGGLPYTGLFAAGGFVTCGPLVHSLHARPGAALASFGARAGLPAIAGLVTYAMIQASSPHDGQDHVAPGWQGALFGGVLIMGAFAGALVIDYGYLAVMPTPTGFVARF
jgi:hypothetical protein